MQLEGQEKDQTMRGLVNHACKMTLVFIFREPVEDCKKKNDMIILCPST